LSLALSSLAVSCRRVLSSLALAWLALSHLFAPRRDVGPRLANAYVFKVVS
jgi:hypothetical protein